VEQCPQCRARAWLAITEIANMTRTSVNILHLSCYVLEAYKKQKQRQVTFFGETTKLFHVPIQHVVVTEIISYV